MKKLMVPVLLGLFAMGMSEREAKAGISIGISIGDSHRHLPPPVVIAPPVVISRPPVVVVRPPIVECERAPVYVKECDRVPPRHWPRRDDHRRYDRYDRHDDRRDWRR